jgi:hypothetical protein
LHNIVRRECFSPLSWIAFLIKIPLIIIQKAGLESEEKGAIWILNIYRLVICVLKIIILALCAGKLRISIPWYVIFK